MLTDLRFALRQLRKTPGFTLLAILTFRSGLTFDFPLSAPRFLHYPTGRPSSTASRPRALPPSISSAQHLLKMIRALAKNMNVQTK